MPETAKLEQSIALTDAGIQTDFIEKESMKRSIGICFNFEPGSKRHEMRAVHFSKHSEPSISTDAGREIDFNDEQPTKARASISVSRDPDSNVSEESDTHPSKQR
jgi:hypothetical protein